MIDTETEFKPGNKVQYSDDPADAPAGTVVRLTTDGRTGEVLVVVVWPILDRHDQFHTREEPAALRRVG